jgi:hypothetical protein
LIVNRISPKKASVSAITRGIANHSASVFRLSVQRHHRYQAPSTRLTVARYW